VSDFKLCWDHVSRY